MTIDELRLVDRHENMRNKSKYNKNVLRRVSVDKIKQQKKDINVGYAEL